MSKIEVEKEEIVSYLEQSIEAIKDAIVQSEDMDEIGYENNPHVRQLILDLVETIHDMREKDFKFYKELLEQLPQIEYFNEAVEDISQLRYILSNPINSSDSEQNARNFAELMKSSKIFYFINKKSTQQLTDDDLLQIGNIGFIKDYFKAVWPSVKQEELLGILLYINSGKATKDYIEFLSGEHSVAKEVFLYKKFKAASCDLKVFQQDEENFVEVRENRSSKKIAPKHYMDSGAIIDEENRILYVGFATSEYETSEQKKQYFQKLKILKDVLSNPDNVHHKLYGYKIKSSYITNSLINENELDKGEREHQKPFLESFAVNLTKSEKNLINCASILSLVGNITSEDSLKGLDVKELIHVNPFISGADTLWIHDKFAQLKQLPEESLMLEFRDFIVSSAQNILDVLKKLPDFELSKMSMQHATVLKHVEKMINASLENFNITNMDNKDIFNSDFIEKIKNISVDYKNIHKNKFSGAMPENVDFLEGKKLYNRLNTLNNVENYIEVLQEDLQDKIKINHENKSREETRQQELYNNASVQAKKLEKYLKNKVLLFSHEELIKLSLTEIIYVTNLFPAREAEVVMTGKIEFKQSSSFMKNFKNWKENKTNSDENKEKFKLASIILEHSRNFDTLEQKLKEYHENYSFKSTKSLKKFKALNVNSKRRSYAAQLRRLENIDTPFSLFMKTIKRGDSVDKDKLVAFLQIKAEKLNKNFNNEMSLKSFHRCLDEVKKLNMLEDPDVQTAFKLALPDIVPPWERPEKNKLK